MSTSELGLVLPSYSESIDHNDFHSNRDVWNSGKDIYSDHDTWLSDPKFPDFGDYSSIW